MSQDELDTLIMELAEKISNRYGHFGKAVYNGIINGKGEIRTWLKTNKIKVNKILKTL